MKSKCQMFAAAILIASGMVLSPQTGVAQDNKMEKQDNMPKGDMKNKMGDSKMKMSMDELKTWPEAAQMAANDMMEKYGKPDEITPTMLGWHNNGPWAKTVVFKKEYQHDFPAPHTDLLQQWISHKVPANKLNELAKYDGSVVVERTTGMISARCDKEGANFLALNLAHDIIMGKRTVEEAREMYGAEIMKMKAGQMTEYTKGLIFAPDTNAADPDMPLKKMGM